MADFNTAPRNALDFSGLPTVRWQEVSAIRLLQSLKNDLGYSPA